SRSISSSSRGSRRGALQCALPRGRRTRQTGAPEESPGSRAIDGAAASASPRLIRSFSSLPGLKYGTCLGGTSTLSPVLGLRPLRDSRRRRRKLPNPRSSIFSPRCRASTMLWNTASTMTSECFLVRSDTLETSSTSSALVMREDSDGVRRPPRPGRDIPDRPRQPRRLGTAAPLLEVLEVIAERHFRTPRRLGVGFPVGTELRMLECADAETDLPLLGDEADDLHLVVLAGLQLQLLGALRRVELRNVNEAFDAVGQLDERAEVGQPHHLALDDVADVPGVEEFLPDARLQ